MYISSLPLTQVRAGASVKMSEVQAGKLVEVPVRIDQVIQCGGSPYPNCIVYDAQGRCKVVSARALTA